jgi:hypothetical protein
MEEEWTPQDQQVPMRSVRLLLKGRHTPVLKRKSSVLLEQRDAEVGSAFRKQSREPEESLEPLFCEAVAIAEQRLGAAQLPSEVWSGLTSLLPMLIAAQSVLLEAECRRCSVVEKRSGRACSVRFRSYDLSTLDPPSLRDTASSHEVEQQVVDVLMRLVLAQLRWLGCGKVRCARRAQARLHGHGMLTLMHICFT